MDGDARWYEAAFVVGATNALNVAADGLAAALPPLGDAAAGPEAAAVFADVRAFYGAADVPTPFRVVARDPAYLADLWGAVKRAFADGRLTRRHKEALAFAVFTVVASLGAAIPIVMYFALGDRSAGLLERLRVWMTRNNAVILAVILAVIAAKVIGDAISGLT